MKAPLNKKYTKLIQDIGHSISRARENAARAVNTELLKGNWEIGRHIVEYEQDGSERAEYGSELLGKLSKDLTARFGKGFGRRNVLDMRRFYLTHEKWQTVSAKLSWSHYIELMSIGDDKARQFYEQQCINENWSVRELEKQKDSLLYERRRLGGKKKKALAPAKKMPVVSNATDIIKDPYVLDFLNIEHKKKISEKQLEQKIIDNLQRFLLELGKGFAFIGRQYRISIRNNHFKIDLVFYHRILKCFVLIDLKTRKVKHNDIGQMNLYLNYFKTEENTEGDNEPIGIILSAEKDEVLVEYAMGGISNKIFVSQYQLYLPKRETLQKKVNELIHEK
jgi:predicted nuclease of restriction endonuclease-like (RecB) superfamily